MKIVTDFGQKEVKIKKQFDVLDEKFCIVDYPFKYMNSLEPLELRTVVHFKTGVAIHFLKAHHRQTLKDFLMKSEKAIQNLVSLRGEKEFKEELKKFETIN